MTFKKFYNTCFLSLHDVISERSKNICSSYVKLKMQLLKQKDKLRKVQEEKFIPRSAKFKFSLLRNSSVEKLDEFNVLNKKVEEKKS